MSIREQMSQLSHEERLRFLEKKQKEIAEKFKTIEEEQEEWCCKDCQWKLLNDGERGCVGCACECHEATKNWIKYKNSLSKEEKENITELIFKP
jgi:hypothetical protein